MMSPFGAREKQALLEAADLKARADLLIAVTEISLRQERRQRLADAISCRQRNSMTDRTAIDPKLLEILVCPLTKGPLEYDRERQELVSRKAKLAYPIRDGIPIMLPEEARRLD